MSESQPRSAGAPPIAMVRASLAGAVALYWIIVFARLPSGSASDSLTLEDFAPVLTASSVHMLLLATVSMSRPWSLWATTLLGGLGVLVLPLGVVLTALDANWQGHSDSQIPFLVALLVFAHLALCVSAWICLRAYQATLPRRRTPPQPPGPSGPVRLVCSVCNVSYPSQYYFSQQAGGPRVCTSCAEKR